MTVWPAPAATCSGAAVTVCCVGIRSRIEQLLYEVRCSLDGRSVKGTVNPALGSGSHITTLRLLGIVEAGQ